MVNETAFRLKHACEPRFKARRGSMALMTPSLILRPVLACLAVATLSACGMVDSDPNRFESMAEAVAAVPIEGEAAPVEASTRRTAAENGLRPALQVQVMDPHALWDARDGGLRGMIDEAGPKMAEAAAPIVAEAMIRRTTAAVSAALPGRTEPAPAVGATIQLGAFSSETAARAAWSRLNAGPAARALNGLTPRYESVQVNGRALTRLKVGPVAPHSAAVICRAAEVSDPWCRHRA